MASSMFRRVTRYPQRYSIDEAENRLTEVTAAVANQSPRIAEGMVRALRCWDDSETVPIVSVSVTTQKAVTGDSTYGWVDLELAVTTLDETDEKALRTIWVEVKHGSYVHGTQLDTYSEAAAEEVVTPKIILLVPRSSQIDGGETYRQDWEQFAAELKHETADIDAPVASWLLNQYFEFLREEQLMEEDRISLEAAYAMQQAPQADAATSAVVRRAIEHVERSWGKRTRGSKHFGFDSYHHFEWPLENEGYTMLELMVKRDDSSPEPTGGYVFFAGLTFAKRSDPFREQGEESKLAPGFEVFDSGGWGRRMRLLRPEALLQSEDPEGQSQLLADWIVETFRSIDGSFVDG